MIKRTWSISFTTAAEKKSAKLNDATLTKLFLLVEELSIKGPAAVSWPNYGKLSDKKNRDKRHCHLKKGKPTYVCCWEVTNLKAKMIEVYYVGTHENAPY
jgi:hypothetical protein